MSRTDAILAAIREDLEARRSSIDADDGLRSVSIAVKLSERTGKPSMVIYRPESQRLLKEPCAPKRGTMAVT